MVDFTREISGLVSGRLNEAAANRGSGVSAFAPSALGPADQFAGSAFGSFDPIPALGYAPSDAVVFKNPTMTRPDGSAVWAKGFYGQVTQDAQGPLLRTQTSLYGGAIGFLSVIAFVAAAIYLAAVRPKVREYRKSRSSSSGPYGPW